MPFTLNARALARPPYGARQAAVLSEAGRLAAHAEIASWPGYAPTPLLSLPKTAARAGIARLWYKDESRRFHLKSFKALGGAYAVLRLLQREIGPEATSAALRGGEHAEAARAIAVASATDGNHGRSVAWGAQMFGCRAVIYIHEHVSEARERAIAGFGAEVRRVPGTYDDSVRICAGEAARNGWHVISDTSYDGYMQVPAEVMQGYTVMVGEAAEQLGPERPSHIFVQGGVGGLAAAVASHFWQLHGPERPWIVVVEPERADCLYQSALAGRPASAKGDLDTIMAGLACGEISPLAWTVLAEGADAFMTVPDVMAAVAMRALADRESLVGGESGIAGLAGLLAAVADLELYRAIRLQADSRVLLFGSEGDTDPELYRRLVGRGADEVGRR